MTVSATEVFVLPDPECGTLYLKNFNRTQASDSLGANWNRTCLSRFANYGAVWQIVFLRLMNILIHLMNRLQPSATKSEFMWFVPPRHHHQFPLDCLAISSVLVALTWLVHDLGVYLDSDVSMRSHAHHASRLHELWYAFFSKSVAFTTRCQGSQCWHFSPVWLCSNWVTACNVALAGLPYRELDDQLQSCSRHQRRRTSHSRGTAPWPHHADARILALAVDPLAHPNPIQTLCTGFHLRAQNCTKLSTRCHPFRRKCWVTTSSALCLLNRLVHASIRDALHWVTAP